MGINHHKIISLIGFSILLSVLFINVKAQTLDTVIYSTNEITGVDKIIYPQPTREKHIICIKIWINNVGKVIQTSFAKEKSNSDDENLIKLAEEKALSYKFTPAEENKIKTGYITFHFQPN